MPASPLRGLAQRLGDRRAASQQAARAARAIDTADLAAARAGREVEEAASAAVDAGLPPDALLLDEQERRVAAGATEAQPYGNRGVAGTRGPVKTGFAVTAGALLAVGSAYALVTVRHQLVLLLISLFVAIGLDPAVRFFVRRGLSRSLSVALVSLLTLALLVGFLASLAAPLSREIASLIDATPGYLQQLQDRSSTLGRVNEQLHLTERAQALASEGFGGDTAGNLLEVGSAVAAGIFDTVIVLVLIVYFLADLPRITHAAYRLAPRHRRPRVGLLGDAIVARVGGYVLGNVATSVIAFFFTYVVLVVLDLPYALVLATLVGVLDLVPLVGSTIGGAIAALVALSTQGTTAAVVVVVFTFVYRLVADYLINPVVLRRTVDVSPLVTVIAVVIGGGLLGVVGALVAVPTAAAVQLLLTEVVYPQRDAQVAP
ncbi:MAG: rane protein yrrI [Frankiales bacterium]|nr:rane protein yrrI [Frankiales bacterium]